jgi:hypothetical protein
MRFYSPAKKPIGIDAMISSSAAASTASST